ncbi:Ran-specific GTPase-activating protein 30, partial [Dispira simplex]
MDEMFTNLAIQTVTLVGKAAFGAAGTIALLSELPDSDRFIKTLATSEEMEQLRGELEMRLRLVVPAIDLIDILAARGNTSLTAVIPLTTALRRQTESLSRHLEQLEAQLADDSQQRIFTKTRSDKKVTPKFEKEIEGLQKEIRDLLHRIGEMVPFLNLALTTSGAHLGAGLPTTVSPARLLQASSCLQLVEKDFVQSPVLFPATRASPTVATSPAPGVSSPASFKSLDSSSPPGSPAGNIPWSIEVQPQFTLTLFSLFTSSVRHKAHNDFTWKEEYPKCRGYLRRVRHPMMSYAYEFVLVEDLNDGRYHEDLSLTNITSDTCVPGETRVYPVIDIVRLHYSSAGQLLHIEDSTRPVLVLQVQTIPSGPTGDATPSTPSLASSLASLALNESVQGSTNAGVGRDISRTIQAKPAEKPVIRTIPKTPNRPLPPKTGATTPGFQWLALQVFGEEVESDVSDIEPGQVDQDNSDAEDKHNDDERRQTRVTRSSKARNKDVIVQEKGRAMRTGRLSKVPDKSYEPTTPDATGPSTVVGTPTKDKTQMLLYTNSPRHSELSLLEYLLRLAALEVCEQTTHLNISDEKLALFLMDEHQSAGSSTRPSGSSITNPFDQPHRTASAESLGHQLNSSGSL